MHACMDGCMNAWMHVCSFVCLFQCQPNDRLNRFSIGRYRSMVVWFFLLNLLCAQLDWLHATFSYVYLYMCMYMRELFFDRNIFSVVRTCLTDPIIWRLFEVSKSTKLPLLRNSITHKHSITYASFNKHLYRRKRMKIMHPTNGKHIFGLAHFKLKCPKAKRWNEIPKFDRFWVVFASG